MMTELDQHRFYALQCAREDTDAVEAALELAERYLRFLSAVQPPPLGAEVAQLSAASDSEASPATQLSSQEPQPPAHLKAS